MVHKYVDLLQILLMLESEELVLVNGAVWWHFMVDFDEILCS